MRSRFKVVSPRLPRLRAFLNSPQGLLRLDSSGALVTCVMTGLGLPTGLIPTGLPVEVLWAMAAAAGGLFLASLISSQIASTPAKPLRWIAFANLAYVLAVFAICAVHLERLTVWGITYFLLEAALVVPLALWEKHIADRDVGV